jgi:hypothetical protein
MSNHPVPSIHASLETTRLYLSAELPKQPAPDEQPPAPLPPELVSAILRDQGSPLYPSRISVYCDACGATDTGEYMVSTEQTRAERLDVARTHLRTKGWRIDEAGDFCTSCAWPITAAVLDEVAAERVRQDATWGEQNHPDGTGPEEEILAAWPAASLATYARNNCQRQAEMGIVTWLDILGEEVAEALAESDPARLRTELVQIAAVAVAWAEAIDRRSTTTPA